MIGREHAVPLNRAVRSGTIANPLAESGMACQHFDLDSADAPERPIRASRDRPPRARHRRLGDLELPRDEATGAITHRDPAGSGDLRLRLRAG
jgi:hypothetical protein